MRLSGREFLAHAGAAGRRNRRPGSACAGHGPAHVDEPVDEPLMLQIYPGADAASTLYEDDGVSFGYARGDWMAVDLGWSDRERRLDLRLARGSRMRPPAERRIRVRVAGSSVTRDVVFAGAPTMVRV